MDEYVCTFIVQSRLCKFMGKRTGRRERNVWRVGGRSVNGNIVNMRMHIHGHACDRAWKHMHRMCTPMHSHCRRKIQYNDGIVQIP